MNDWDGITTIGVVTGISYLWMIGMEPLTLGGDRNHILMNDWNGITNIGGRQELHPYEWLRWNYQHWGEDKSYVFMNDWDGITNIGLVTGITSLWMTGMELLTLGWWQELHPCEWLGWNYLHWGDDRNYTLMNDSDEITNIGWWQELHTYEWLGWNY